jgi:hypothetical protein
MMTHHSPLFPDLPLCCNQGQSRQLEHHLYCLIDKLSDEVHHFPEILLPCPPQTQPWLLEIEIEDRLSIGLLAEAEVPTVR